MARQASTSPYLAQSNNSSDASDRLSNDLAEARRSLYSEGVHSRGGEVARCFGLGGCCFFFFFVVVVADGVVGAEVSVACFCCFGLFFFGLLLLLLLLLLAAFGLLDGFDMLFVFLVYAHEVQTMPPTR